MLSMKKSGVGGCSGGCRFDPFVGGDTCVAEPWEEDAREDGVDDDVDIAGGWSASVKTRVGLKESKRPSFVGGVGSAQRRSSKVLVLRYGMHGVTVMILQTPTGSQGTTDMSALNW